MEYAGGPMIGLLASLPRTIWAALAVLVLVGGGYAWISRLQASAAAFEQRASVAEAQARQWATRYAQAEEARRLADDEAARLRLAARQYEDVRAAIRGIEDAPLPDAFRAVLDSLFGSPAR